MIPESSRLYRLGVERDMYSTVTDNRKFAVNIDLGKEL